MTDLPRGHLRKRLSEPGILLAPGIYDAMSGLLAEQSGAEAVYLSGASLSYTRFARPDIGLVSMAEVADTIALISDRISLPIIVDADTGFGNALNVQRTVRAFERAGAAALQIEDQTSPKRCGHLRGKSVISTAEMTGKVKAALDARSSSDLLIIARTDAVAVEGIAAAIDRAAAYAEAGADVLFIDAPESEQQMRDAVAALGSLAPLMANMVEGGRTPLMSAGQLAGIGFRLVIFPGGAVRALVATLQNYYASLIENGTTEPFLANMLDFNALNDVIETDGMIAQGRLYDEGTTDGD